MMKMVLMIGWLSESVLERMVDAFFFSRNVIVVVSVSLLPLQVARSFAVYFR
jgi:hypothetical protein